MNNRIVRIGLMSVAVAALVVIGIVLLVGRGTGAQLTPSSAQALTPQNATPARSDAGTLVFSRYSFHDQGYDLYLVRSDGRGLRRLTTSPAVSEEYAHWSPDGARIAYTEWGRGGASVWVRNVDGSGKFHVAVKGGAQGSSYGWSLGWSPNGKQIMSAHDDAIKPPFNGLRVVNADGSGRRVVPGAPSWPHFATWAPNGKIVFVRVRSDRAFRGGDLFVTNPDGSGLQRLTKGAWLTSPSVSPDASTIAAYATRADRLVAMPLPGRRPCGHAARPRLTVLPEGRFGTLPPERPRHPGDRQPLEPGRQEARAGERRLLGGLTATVHRPQGRCRTLHRQRRRLRLHEGPGRDGRDRPGLAALMGRVHATRTPRARVWAVRPTRDPIPGPVSARLSDWRQSPQAQRRQLSGWLS